MKLLALDGNSILNRAFYGINLLTTKRGQYTNAIYGFLTILNKLRTEIQPDAIAIAFDMRAPTFRHNLFKGYKAGRKGMPEELQSQLPILKTMLDFLGYVMVECEGFEADDILGTLAQACENDGHSCVIVTGDRDCLQLVSRSVSVRLTTTKCGKPDVTLYDDKKIMQEYGLTPSQLIEIKTIQGDTSDNIPGIVGIGKKNAMSLVHEFGTLDNIYNNLDSERIKPSIKNKLIEGKDSAYMSYTLGKIRKDVPIDLNIQNYVRQEGNRQKAIKLMARLELFSLIEKLESETNFVQETFSETDIYPKIVYDPNLDELKELLLTQKKADIFALYLDKKISSISFITENSIFILENKPGLKDFLKFILENDSIEKRTHNAKALFYAAQKIGINAKNIIFCTFLAAHLLRPSSSNYKLDHLTVEYTGCSVKTDEKWPENHKLLIKRSIEFSKVIGPLFTQIEESNQNSLLKDIEIPLAAVLSSMEQTGFAVNKEGISQYGQILADNLTQMQKEIHDCVGYSFNIQSPHQLGEALYQTLGLPTGKRTGRGYSTSAEELERLRFAHPAIEKILEYRVLHKIKSTYCDTIVKAAKKDNRIHTTFSQTETRTGRLSSTAPNLQNIPVRSPLGKELRRFFCAKEGFVLVDADYSQIELRILAHMSGDTKMIKSFQNNEDIHTITASQVFNIPIELVTSATRLRAKAINFGIIYGMGPFSLSKELNITQKQANEYIENYLAEYSGIKNYTKQVLNSARKQGFVETLFKRRRYIPELTSSNHNIRSFGERVAMNMPIQGTAADIIKIAMIRINNHLSEQKLNAKLILQVHDELIIEASQEDAQAAAQILTQEMQEIVKLKVPLIAKAVIGKTWYEAKS